MNLASSTPLPTLLLIAATALVATGCGINIDIGGDTTRRAESDSVPADQLRTVDITTGNGRIDVTTDDIDTVEITAILRDEDAGDATSEFSTTDEQLTIRGECDSGWFESCSVGYEIVVPERLDVTVRSDNGQIDVVGVGGDLVASTDNGRIDVRDVAGDVDLESDNGRIAGTDLAGASARARSDNGQISLAFLAAPSSVGAKSGNGQITIEVPDDDTVYDIDASSDNGSIRNDLRSDPSAERVITAATDNGSIHLQRRGSGAG